MVSIKEIARQAGSHSTVSRALHNSSMVNEKTTKLIHRIALEKGYVAQYGPMLRGMNAPIVLINIHHYSYHAGEFVYSIRIDDFAGARAAVAHLTELGHRRIGYIGDRLGFQSDAGRLAGYRSSWKTPAFAKTRIWSYMPMAVRRAGSYVAITAWKDRADGSFLLQRPAGAGSSQIVRESTAPPR